MSHVRCIGLDVHAETIAVAVAVAEPDGEVRSLGVMPNRSESIRTRMKKQGPADQWRVCDEAGPTGYVVYWELTALGVTCEVPSSPSPSPRRSGRRRTRGTTVASTSATSAAVSGGREWNRTPAPCFANTPSQP